MDTSKTNLDGSDKKRRRKPSAKTLSNPKPFLVFCVGANWKDKAQKKLSNGLLCNLLVYLFCERITFHRLQLFNFVYIVLVFVTIQRWILRILREPRTKLQLIFVLKFLIPTKRHPSRPKTRGAEKSIRLLP